MTVYNSKITPIPAKTPPLACSRELLTSLMIVPMVKEVVSVIELSTSKESGFWTVLTIFIDWTYSYRYR